MSQAVASEMKVQREDLNPCTVLLKISCSNAQVRGAFDKAYKELGKKLRLPGFRPGHAPRAMLERVLVKEDVLNAAADQIIRSAYKQALEQEDLKPEGQGSVNMKKLDEATQECEFEVKVPMAAIVNLADYEGVPVERPAIAVEESDIDHQIDELRKRGGKREKITDRGIKDGDMAVVNIKVHGEAGDGKTFMTTAGATFPELDKALIGMEAEQMKHLTLTFPDNFQESDWTGKKLDVDMTVRSVNAVKLPEVDDDFAKSLNTENVGDLRERIRAGLERAREQMLEDIVNEQILSHLVNNSEIQVADNTWEAVLNRRLYDIQQELNKTKKSLEDHAKENGMTVEEFVERLKEEAQLHVKRAVVVERVFKAQEMKISDQEATQHFLQIAQENEIPEEQLEAFAKQYGAAIRDEVIYRAMYAKVMGFLRDKAKVTEVSGETAPKPAKATKKPAAAKTEDKPAAKKKPAPKKAENKG
ncbi:MAG: trigger factor [Fimbriimonadaceae bacterium]|nr:trigger factor [Fimbriimonadaceae bacterium]